MAARVALVCSSDVWKEKDKYAARRVDEILKGGYHVFVRLRPENVDEIRGRSKMRKSELLSAVQRSLDEIKQEQHTEESERKESWMETKKKEEEKEGGAAAAATETAQETTEEPEQYRRRLEIAHEETVAMLPHNIQGAVQEAFEKFIESFEKISLSGTQV